jgi:hypothetical protein
MGYGGGYEGDPVGDALFVVGICLVLLTIILVILYG